MRPRLDSNFSKWGAGVLVMTGRILPTFHLNITHEMNRIQSIQIPRRPPVSDSLVLVTEEPPLAVVELNRKRQKNALSMALRDELEVALGALEADSRVKAVILTGGAGGRRAGVGPTGGLAA